MKNYELLIHAQQPSCGGKPPFKNEIRMVSTDDPVEYVRRLEPDCEPEVSEAEDGTVVIVIHRNGAIVRYEFCED